MSLQVTVKLSAVAAFQLQSVLSHAIEYRGAEVSEWWRICDATCLGDSVPTTLSLPPTEVAGFISLLGDFYDEYEGLRRIIPPLRKRLEDAHHELTTGEEYRSSVYPRRHRLTVRLAGLQQEHQERVDRLARRVERTNQKLAHRGVSPCFVEQTDQLALYVDRLARRIAETEHELAEDTARRCEGADLPLKADLVQHFQAMLSVEDRPSMADLEDESQTRHDLVALGVPYVVVGKGRDRWRLGSCDSCGSSPTAVELDVLYLSGELHGEYECLTVCEDCASIS